MIEVGLSSRPRLSRLKGQALLKLGQKFDCLAMQSLAAGYKLAYRLRHVILVPGDCATV